MNREEFAAKVKPALKRAGELADKFQQAAADAMVHRWLFWPLAGLVVVGAFTVVGWIT